MNLDTVKSVFFERAQVQLFKVNTCVMVYLYTRRCTMTGSKRNQKQKNRNKKSVTSNGLGNFFRPQKKNELKKFPEIYASDSS